jgi:hypothetical protein
MNEDRIAAALMVGGSALAVVGLALVYLPAGIIAAGVGLALVGLDGRRRA